MNKGELESLARHVLSKPVLSNLHEESNIAQVKGVLGPPGNNVTTLLSSMFYFALAWLSDRPVMARPSQTFVILIYISRKLRKCI